ncbi:hypothetical protein EON82_04455 [bacterium]|nr:MAG: hypothetical protein EON82_04455 [bacterium]
MRATLILSALGLATLAAAQRPAEFHEAAIWDAYQYFRSNDTIKLEMTGNDSFGGVTTPVHVVMYYRLSNDPRTNKKTRAQVDLGIFTPTTTGETLSMRIVGDGTNLYRYDVGRKEVSTTTYGYYGDREPASYIGSDAPKLFAQLRAVTPGVANYLARLLGELNPAGIDFAARYGDWMPGRSRLFFDEVPTPPRTSATLLQASTVTDPITGRVHVRGDDQYVFFGMDRTDTDRTVAFHMIDGDSNPDNGMQWQVQTVNIAIRSANRLLDLNVNIDPSIIPTGAFHPFDGTLGASFRPVTRGQ